MPTITIIFGISLIGFLSILLLKVRELNTGKALIPLSFQKKSDRMIVSFFVFVRKVFSHATLVRVVEKIENSFTGFGHAVSSRMKRSETGLLGAVNGKKKLNGDESKSSFLQEMHLHKKSTLKGSIEEN